MSASGTQPSSPKDKPKRGGWLAAFGVNSLAVSILIHVIFGVGATFLIVEHFQKKHINFHATEPPGRPNEVEHKVELSKKNNVESAPPDLKRIATTDISPITLPDVPVVATPDEVTPQEMAGVDGTMGSGIGAGGGAGGGGGGNPLFGAPTGDGFVGDFYDMKQTADQKPNIIANNPYEQEHPDGLDPRWGDLPSTREELRVLHSYVAGFNDSILADYYHAPTTLFAPQIFIPELSASEGPKAFGVEKTVQPRRWIVVYKARIIPPTTGDFRFIGFADDYLVVRIDDQNVLDACWNRGQLDGGVDVSENVGLGPAYTADYRSPNMPLACGPWIHMTAGIEMNMKVVLGEGPGGQSSFFLFIQQKGVEYPTGDYPVFQLADVPLPTYTNPRGVPVAFSGKRMVFGMRAP